MTRRRLSFVLSTLCVSAILLATACGKHKPAGITGPGNLTGPEGASGLDNSLKTRPGKIQVCHVGEDGTKSILTISENALAAHLQHGDVQLVDEDGDGWFAAESECVPRVDCNDQDPNVHPGAAEACDGIDADCDGQRDDPSSLIGTQAVDILRDPARISESAMGNLVADAMRARYAGVDAAITNSGGLRQDIRIAPPAGGEAAGEITCGEVFAVLPFGNRAVILTITGAQLEQALVNGVSPACNGSITTGRSPQVSGLKVAFACNGATPAIAGMWKTPQGIGGPQIPIGPTDTIRLVTNDFLSAGEDGYTVFQQGTNVVETGDLLVVILGDYITAHSPVAPVVEGRIIKQ